MLRSALTQQHSRFAMGWLSKWRRTIRDDANFSWQLIRTIIRLATGENLFLSFTPTNSQMKTQVSVQVSISRVRPTTVTNLQLRNRERQS
jgi:hypothetical protein